MKNKTIFLVALIAVAVSLLVSALVSTRTETVTTVSAPAGTTYSLRKIAEQNLVSSSTVYSMYNSDATDRIIDSAVAYLANGVSTTTQYTVKCATSTSAYTFGSNTNYTFNSILSTTTFGTTTGTGMYVATTAPGVMGSGNAIGTTTRVWPTATYNVCAVTTQWGSNSNLLDSSVTGYFGFPYTAQ